MPTLPQRTSYISYLMSVDPDGHTIALIRRKGDNTFVVFTPARQDGAAPIVEIKEVTGEQELRAHVAGDIVAADDNAFNEQLDAWGYEGSDNWRPGNETEEEPADEAQAHDPAEGNGTIVNNDSDHGASTGIAPPSADKTDTVGQAPGSTQEGAEEAKSDDKDEGASANPDANAADPAASKAETDLKGEDEAQSRIQDNAEQKAGVDNR